MAKCPNVSHPDWKALVKENGKEGAMKKYIENGYEIPSPDGSKKSKRGKSTIEKGVGLMGDFFKSKSTLDSLEKHPETAAKIIDELQSLYPDVKIYKDGLFDEDGNWKTIPAGKVGMHYRSAVMSAIAYSNDSYMETVPHEFAHEYIDMYRDTQIVKDAIAKYGEERLVTLIGRKYAGQKMSSTFESFLKDFWKMVRNTFGHGNVVDILTDSFAKNERLGEPLSRGNAIHNFQDAQPQHKKSTVMNHNKDIERGSDDIILKDKEVERKEIAKALEESNLESWWNKLKKTSSRLAQGKDNYAGIDNSFISFINDVVSDEKESLPKIEQKIKEGKDSKVQLSKREEQAYDTFIKLSIAIKHKEQVQSSYLESNGKIVNQDEVNNQIEKEIESTYKKKEENLGSKHKYIQEIAKGINKVVSWATNSRLWAKYLSGGENTVFSKLVYKGLNDAREVRAGFSQGFNDLFVSKPNSYMDGSIFHNPKSDISDLETTTFSLDERNDMDSIDITKSELLNIYLMLRQDGAKTGILKNGIQLKAIKGRDIDLNTKFKLSEKQLLDIKRMIEGDTEAMTLVGEIDSAMNYSHDKVNSVFKLMEGYNMDKVENYFPVFHGSENLDITKSKNIIDDMRSLRLRMDSEKAVRIEDTFQVLSGINLSNSSYTAYAIPIHNAQKAIDSVQGKYNSKDEQQYFESLQGTINKIQDSGTLFSTQGDQKASKLINKVQGNFAVALLAKNLGVVFKQQVSLITAQEEINNKYIRQAGASLGPVSFINPFKLLKQLGKGDETMMPLEWQQLTDNADYQELIKHPLFRERFEGVVSRETGEAVMGRMIADDKIKIPFTKGKYVTKSRLMQSITIMDTLTILRLYNAVKLETQDRMGEPAFQSMTDAQIEQHNVNRLQDIVDKTQPTFDQTNRTKMSQSSNPILRGLTMFSSATQKMSMLLLEGVIDYANNPTNENKMKLFKRSLNIGLTTSIMLTTIDMMRYALLNDWDDDDTDEVFEKYAISSLKSTVGSFQGVGSALNIIISQLDSNPWYQTAQDPFQHVVQEGSEAVANAAKGNFDRALKQTVGATFKVTGLQISIVNNTQKLIERVN